MSKQFPEELGGPGATVLLSGGVDSTTLLAAMQRSFDATAALFVDYGQPAATSEQRAAVLISERAGVPLATVTVAAGIDFSQPEISGRNSLLLAVAFSLSARAPHAIGLGIHAGTGYADCESPFIESMQHLFDIQSGGVVRLCTPFASWSKQEVYDFATETRVPIDLTHSCEISNTACGSCRSCLDRESFHV